MTDERVIDFSELDGFQFPCRARRIAEWRERKEEKAFEKKCRSLKVRRWRHRLTGEALRRYRARTKKEAARQKEKRHAAAREDVIACSICGAEWVRIPNINGRKSAYCGDPCRAEAKSRREKARYYDVKVAKRSKIPMPAKGSTQ